MGALEEFTQMREQGIPDSEIINSLRKRFSPKEINDAISQAQIKNAVSKEDNEFAPPTPDENYQQNEPRIIEADYPQQDLYSPQPQQEYAPQEQSNSYNDYAPSSGTDTMIEVAEQVYFQKIQKLQKQVDALTEFKTLAGTKIEIISDRLKRIESTIDEMQTAILEKVGSYGGTLQSIKKEMSMMQDSFSKVVDKAIRPHHATAEHSPSHTIHHKSSKKK